MLFRIERGDYETEEAKKNKALGIKRAWAEGRIGDKKWRRAVSEAMSRRRTVGDLSTEEFYRKAAESRKQTLSQGPTTPERLIMEILDDSGIDYEYEFILGGRRYDFRLDGYPILIEFDGAYWHSLPKTQRSDAYKNRLVRKKDGVLFRIDGAQFNCKYEKDMMATALQPAINLRKEWVGYGVKFYQNSEEAWRIDGLQARFGHTMQDALDAVDKLFAMHDRVKQEINARKG